MKKILFLSLCFISFTLSAQDRYISGRITDANDGETIIGASVFLDNTTIGITTDMDGRYRLRIPVEGSYRLTVSHVGYQSVFKEIEPGRTSLIFDTALNTVELEELTVSAGVRFRRTDINLFWNKILGKNSSRKTIQATNPETVYYYYNPKTRILKVTCREPLQIINYEMGYQIQCVLENFTHDYNTEITDWRSQCIFTELEPENQIQKNNWEKKRQEVYHVSLTKFIKSLYNNSLQEDGFVLGAFGRNTDSENPYQISLNPNRLLMPSITNNSKTLIFLNEHILICYGRPVTADDLIKIRTTKGNDFIKSRGVLMNLLYSNSIQIYPDGTYTNKLQIGSIGTSNTLTDLCMRLPIDYIPDGSVTLSRENTITENFNDFDRIVHYFDQQLNIFPQEKIHLHTDRDIYVSGEKIWFKAYLTDAATHQPVSNSRYVYVEMISPTDTLINRVMVRPVDGMFYGNLPLTEYIPSGDYTLRAYTQYMENLGDDYFFKKNIRIDNLAFSINQNRPTAQRGLLKDDFMVSFFPEGGNLPDGVFSKVAFKAINVNGYPETVSGRVFDEKGNEMVSVETFHAGMGVFEYMAESGKRYYLRCKNVKGLEKQFELPQPVQRAYALTANMRGNNVTIQINRSVDAPDIHCSLLAHCRGSVIYFSEWNPANEAVLFDVEELPAGIIQFILFDEKMNPLSERLVFSKNYNLAQIEFHTDKAQYTKREKIVTTLSITDSEGNTFDGHLSVAITDDKDIAVDSMTTILSSLLLSSELKGYIDNPAYYLQENTESAIALDYLMMTHGWRRYSIPDIVSENPKQPQIPFQTSQSIAGKIKSLTRFIAVTDSEIFIQTREGDYGIISTDAQGTFMFNAIEYPDSTSFFLHAQNRRGSNQVELVLDGESFPKLVHASQSPEETRPVLSELTEPDAFIAKAEQRARYDDDMWLIQLDEVEITARRIERNVDSRLDFTLNKSSDVTIRKEDIEKTQYRNVADYLSSVSGVSVIRDPGDPLGRRSIVNIRGSASVGADNAPLILIDGVPAPPNFDMSDLSADEVESIDVFKGAGASVFGVRGANGVISITTKRGGTNRTLQRDEPNYTVYTPLGYQRPVEFYSPVYETLESKYLTIPDFRTTIFWKPDIVISEDEEEAAFEFYTSDFSTTYSVVIEGLTTDGRIIRQVEKIKIE